MPPAPPAPYRDDLGQAHARIERLEEELREERAITAGLASASASEPDAAYAGARPPRVKPVALFAAIGVVASAFFAFHAARHNPKAILLLSVDSVMNNVETYRGEHIKVEGDVVPRQTVVREVPCETRLEIERGGLRMPVVYEACVLPDLYADRSEVVVDGALASDGLFHAKKLAVRVPSY